MLDTIEQRVAATVGDALSTRAHLTVFAAPGPAAPIASGAGRVIVALRELSAAPFFQRDEMSFAKGAPPTSRRVVPLEFAVDVRLRVNPAAADENAIRNARTLLLRDVGLTVHALGEDKIRTGTKLRPGAGDPGFDVVTFFLESGKVAPELVDGMIAAELRYKGTAEIWPPDVTGEEGEIDILDLNMVVQTLDVVAAPPRIAAGGKSLIRIAPVKGKRLPKSGDPREPLRLALRVASDLPPESRGRITSGVAGAEAGVRIIELKADGTGQAEYTAPNAPLGNVRSEVVEVHYARRENTRGALLGSTVVKLSEGA